MRFFEVSSQSEDVLRYSMLLLGAKHGLVNIAVNNLGSQSHMVKTLRELGTALAMHGDSQLINFIQFGPGIEDYVLTSTEKFLDDLNTMNIWSLNYPNEGIDHVLSFLETGEVSSTGAPQFQIENFRKPWPVRRQGKHADTILFVISDVLTWRDFDKVSGPDSQVVISVKP